MIRTCRWKRIVSGFVIIHGQGVRFGSHLLVRKQLEALPHAHVLDAFFHPVRLLGNDDLFVLGEFLGEAELLPEFNSVDLGVDHAETLELTVTGVDGVLTERVGGLHGDGRERRNNFVGMQVCLLERGVNEELRKTKTTILLEDRQTAKLDVWLVGVFCLDRRRRVGVTMLVMLLGESSLDVLVLAMRGWD